MNATIIIARWSVREAMRRRIIPAALVLAVLFLLVYSVGLRMMLNETRPALREETHRVILVEGLNMLALMGLYATAFLGAAMGALLGADTLAGEIQSGSTQSVVSKPIQRWQVVLGKWLGFAALLAPYVGLLAGGIVASVWLQARYAVPHVLQGMGLIYLESLLVLTLALMCSSVMSTLATGGVVFGLYGLAFVAGWVEQLGALTQSEAAVNVGIVASLLFPSEALWRRAAYEMQAPFSSSLGLSPFGTFSVPSPLMLAYAALYGIGALALAIRWFARRDL